MYLDIDIGFEREPSSLDEFLKKEGYTESERLEGGTVVYENAEKDWPQLFYSSPRQKSEEGAKPNWDESGFKIVAELNMHYPNEINYMNEAEILSTKIVRKFDGILYNDEDC